MSASLRYRTPLGIVLLVLLLVVGMAAMMFIGPVKLQVSEVIDALLGKGEDTIAYTIVRGSRWPMAVTAALSGASLSVAGLIMQTVFRNPLAGPSVLGISTGASLGVALVMLGAGRLLGEFVRLGAFIGALTGAGVVIIVLVAMSLRVRSNALLLIVGLMVSYLGGSLISLLNFFAPAENIRSYVVWGMGSLAAVGPEELTPFVISIAVLLVVCLFLIKPLNAMLLGDTYTHSLGYSVVRIRVLLLIVSGLLTALTAAYCGPIGFIGMVVPHLVRLLIGTGNHRLLIPASIIGGAVLMVLCALVSVLPERGGIIPINAITPVIGVPVILLIILKRNKIAS